jgi:hypothetical protein
VKKAALQLALDAIGDPPGGHVARDLAGGAALL